MWVRDLGGSPPAGGNTSSKRFQDCLPWWRQAQCAASISMLAQANPLRGEPFISLQCYFDIVGYHRQGTRSKLINLPTDYFEESPPVNTPGIRPLTFWVSGG